MLSFILSTLWIAIFSYFMVWMVSKLCTVGLEMYFKLHQRIVSLDSYAIQKIFF